MPSAFIIGGTGQIGRATATKLLAEGWHVTLASRSQPKYSNLEFLGANTLNSIKNLKHIQLDRQEDGALEQALTDGTDLLVDCIAFDANHAKQLINVQNNIGKLCVISSASVYKDVDGLTLDEALQNGFPNFPIPITIEQPTVDAGDATYSTRKIAMECILLNDCKIPVSILRPSAIYGPYCTHAREWFFVKRLLDGCTEIPVAYDGKIQFQTTSADSIAAAIIAFASKPTSPIMNIADQVAPTVMEIGHIIMKIMNKSCDIIGLPDLGYPPKAGRTPWSIPKPFIVAPSTDFENAGDYETLIIPTIQWLIEATRHQPWENILPVLAAYPYNMFDYKADQTAISSVRIS